MEVFSLVCWGGRTGKQVTFTDAGDVVNSTNHGLRAGARLKFSTTGTLPTGLSSTTTYYVKQGADTAKFLLYPTQADALAGTNQVTFDGTGSGTHTAKSVLMTEYFAQYPGRWGDAGAERCYDGLVAWTSARSTALPTDEEVCEIAEAYTETVSAALTINLPSGAFRCETKVDGVRTPAFHGGLLNNGYIFYQASNSSYGLTLASIRGTLDGVTVTVGAGFYASYIVGVTGFLCTVRNTITIGSKGYSAVGTYGIGISVVGLGAVVENNLVVGCIGGIGFPAYSDGLMVVNNTVTRCAYGMNPTSTTNIKGYFFNNISVGNTTNWLSVSGALVASNNAGLSAEAWLAGVGATRITISTTDFADYANGDFRPALSSAPQVDSGIEYYGALADDISGDERPNYNNGGAEAFDVGCYEFDHGYGNHPASTTVMFSGVHADSEVRVYDASGNEIAGVESSSANPSLTWVLTVGDVRVQILSLEYKNLDFDYTPVAGAVTLPVQQVPDKWYANS